MNHTFRNSIALPTALFLLAISLIEVAGIDLLLADWLYALEGNQWQLKNAWITKAVIHEQGRTLVGVVLLGLVSAIALSYRLASLRHLRTALYFVLVSALISVAIVNVMKELTGIDCPWDLSRYGGTQSYVSLFATLAQGQAAGACFPSGHASGAYCWLGFFFMAGLYKPKWQYRTLASVLSVGVVFGAAQQLRGAHFVSHDIWTLYICWMSASLCYRYLFRLPQRSQRPNRLAGEN